MIFYFVHFEQALPHIRSLLSFWPFHSKVNNCKQNDSYKPQPQVCQAFATKKSVQRACPRVYVCVFACLRVFVCVCVCVCVCGLGVRVSIGHDTTVSRVCDKNGTPPTVPNTII